MGFDWAKRPKSSWVELMGYWVGLNSCKLHNKRKMAQNKSLRSVNSFSRNLFMSQSYFGVQLYSRIPIIMFCCNFMGLWLIHLIIFAFLINRTRNLEKNSNCT